MRRVKAILAALALMVMMMANAAPAMADGWWETCEWNWSFFIGWYLTCDWNPGWDDDSWEDNGWGDDSWGDSGWGDSDDWGDRSIDH